MRVVWKDSYVGRTKFQEGYKYRKHFIERFQGGWTIDVPGDNNIYYSIDCAHNAIDKILGGKTRKDASARQAKGIKIIGTKKDH